MNVATELGTKWLNWPQAIAWVQHGDPEVLREVADAMGGRPLDGQGAIIARLTSILFGDERRETDPEYPTSDDAEKWLFDALRRGHVVAQGRLAPGDALVDIPAAEWQSPRLHWSATVDLGPAAYPGSVLYYDILVASAALEVLTRDAPFDERCPSITKPRRVNRTPAGETRRLAKFFDLADKNNLEELTHDQLFSRYSTWNDRQNKDAVGRKVAALKISAFKKWRKRWRDGERWC